MKPPSTADVHAPQVMPPTARVVTDSDDVAAEGAGARPGLSDDSTSASKPRSSIMLATCSGDTWLASCMTTARPRTRLTLTLPTPSVS